MTTLVPSAAMQFPGGLRCAPSVIAVESWQGHILKHPFGLHAIRRRKGAPWNEEGWDQVEPPVVTAEQRAEASSRITALGDAQQRCPVPELRAGRGVEIEPECYACRAPLLTGCARLLGDSGIGARYAEATEQVLREVADGVAVPRKTLGALLMRHLRNPAVWSKLVIMAVGRVGPERRPVARASRADGVRVELTVRDQGLSWRTTYRIAQKEGSFASLSFMQDHPVPDPRLPLSDQYVVPRGWWERHGS